MFSSGFQDHIWMQLKKNICAYFKDVDISMVTPEVVETLTNLGLSDVP